MKRQTCFTLLLCAFFAQCQAQIFKMDDEPNNRVKAQEPAVLVTPQLAFNDKEHYVSAAMQMDDYLPLIKGKRIGVVGNQTSLIGETHLVDALLFLGVDIRKIYTPEHGFRGNADAGAKVNSGKDELSPCTAGLSVRTSTMTRPTDGLSLPGSPAEKHPYIQRFSF